MASFQNDGLKVQQYVWDYSADGGAAGAISLSSKDGYDPLPDNAIVQEVIARVITSVDSAGDGVSIAWGNTTDPDGYSGAAIAEATLVADYVTNGAAGDAALLWDGTNDHYIPFLCNSTNDRDFSVTISGEAATAGKIVFSVLYLYDSLQ